MNKEKSNSRQRENKEKKVNEKLFHGLKLLHWINLGGYKLESLSICIFIRSLIISISTRAIGFIIRYLKLKFSQPRIGSTDYNNVCSLCRVKLNTAAKNLHSNFDMTLKEEQRKNNNQSIKEMKDEHERKENSHSTSENQISVEGKITSTTPNKQIDSSHNDLPDVSEILQQNSDLSQISGTSTATITDANNIYADTIIQAVKELKNNVIKECEAINIQMSETFGTVSQILTKMTKLENQLRDTHQALCDTNNRLDTMKIHPKIEQQQSCIPKHTEAPVQLAKPFSSSPTKMLELITNSEKKIYNEKTLTVLKQFLTSRDITILGKYFGSSIVIPHISTLRKGFSTVSDAREFAIALKIILRSLNSVHIQRKSRTAATTTK